MLFNLNCIGAARVSFTLKTIIIIIIILILSPYVLIQAKVSLYELIKDLYF